MGDPLGHDECLTPDDVGDGLVGNAEQDDVGVLARLDAALREARRDEPTRPLPITLTLSIMYALQFRLRIPGAGCSPGRGS